MIFLNVDDWFFVLGNKHRRQIMRLCSIRPCYPQQIAEILHLSPSLVTKHIAELEKRNFILKREEQRSEGGRNLQYYFVPFRPRFNFSLANDDLVEIDIIDESEKDVPTTPSRKRIIDITQIDQNEKNDLQEKLKAFISLEEERIEVHKKMQELHEKQRSFFKSIRSNNSQQQILVKIMRFLLDAYGFNGSFSQKDLETDLGVDSESAQEIIQIFSTILNVIKKNSSNEDLWVINSVNKTEKNDNKIKEKKLDDN